MTALVGRVGIPAASHLKPQDTRIGGGGDVRSIHVSPVIAYGRR
jgi:hypothetical protein